jgi:hypothetical protein
LAQHLAAVRHALADDNLAEPVATFEDECRHGQILVNRKS